MKKNGRLIIVSNRLPVTIRKKGRNYQFSPSIGGLATSLGSFYRDCKDYERTLWVGWPGAIPKEKREEVKAKLVKQFACHPVFLSESLVEKYYEGFSNDTLWPLLHSFPAHTQYDLSEWQAYQRANQLFCEEIVKIARPDDTFWIHDYHLMLLPKFLRDRLPTVSIGFFLHIPFPPYDVFRLLPQNKEIAGSLLAADLIGFHTYDYAQSFLTAARRLFGYDNELGKIVLDQRMVLVDVFPIGIDFTKFSTASRSILDQSKTPSIKRTIGAAKLVFSVSRLDYTKGILQSLHAVEEFFDQCLEWREKITFVLVVVPSREKVKRYADLKREIDELVGRVNSKYGTLRWLPIKYIYRNLNFAELIALYSNADIALVTPLRDGMNLIAKEYIAARPDLKGVLILSEMAGSAKELVEALTVNPNSKEEIVEALNKALEMTTGEQTRRNRVMRKRLRNYNVKKWAKSFLEKLSGTVSLSNMLTVRYLNSKRRQKAVKYYAASKRRLFLLDYDGTLAPFYGEPNKAKPSKELVELLGMLAAKSKNKVVIISGREKKAFGRWFPNPHVTLVAEHGGWVRGENTSTWKPTITADETWKKQIKPIMQLFVDRIPESFIEEKTFSLAWHYRGSDVEIGEAAAKEMSDTLTNLTANLDLSVLPGNKLVEIKISGINKGAFYSRYLSKENWDFILAVGDDWTDESLFNALPKYPFCYSIRVGFTPSAARFNLRSPKEVVGLLNILSQQ
ncbi:MAG: hypothetical protein A2126_04050 [Candidatus Woykebacteria bacterium GWB1_45_5]|uniref:Uncharacterized protein n=2 Tax=Candidatus Woykeibacteriota TaxID=1817899 RepID=A0A1G1W1E3_9BACT|nr:MAG: hypothetical protein A2113_01855 [Candidatus Woykebacteria bacterium GWA1_44_8]OGY22321.1 MAG: hypothetical protein A2126_04050 [Candidatus Woykebacteria bacterium GWB1_45_5]